MNSSAMTFCTTFPGIGGMADARTKGEGLTGFAAVRREPSSPTEQMGAVAMVDVVADRVVEGVLDRVGTCANDAGAGREPSPAVRKRKVYMAPQMTLMYKKSVCANNSVWVAW